ncbi:MAG: adenylate kinase family protein [Candidatus Diapherotrites archaeon]|nr:adenylate kinase family protein [Candidatus Diapherotrites archaeon]
MIIIITGTPGTGKTEVAKAVAEELGYELINEKDFCTKRNIGRCDKDELVIPISALKKALEIEIYNKENIVIEGHMLSNIHLDADLVIVLRTNPEVLEKRMKERGYSPEKISDNVMAEILDYCTIHTESKYPKDIIYEIDTSERTVEETTELVLKIISGEYSGDEVDWSQDSATILTRDINKKLNG